MSELILVILPAMITMFALGWILRTMMDCRNGRDKDDDASDDDEQVHDKASRTRILKIANMDQSVIDRQMRKIQNDGWSFTYGNHQYVLFRKFEDKEAVRDGE